MYMGAGLQYRADPSVQADWRGFARYPGGWEEDIGGGERAENCAHLEELAENSVRPANLHPKTRTRIFLQIQGYLAHKKTSTPLGPP